jgi:hypothetical protein
MSETASGELERELTAGEILGLIADHEHGLHAHPHPRCGYRTLRFSASIGERYEAIARSLAALAP